MSPDRLLRWAVRQLPARREEWGRAMQAELAALEPGLDRWRFAVSCSRVALRRPATLKWLPATVVVIGASVLAAGIPVASIRLEAFAMLGLLAAVQWCSRRFGPVAASGIARLVSAAGSALVAAAALMLVAGIRRHDVASPTPVIVVWTAILSIYLVAAASLAAVGGRTLASGAGLGVAAAAAWLAAVLVHPDAASSNGPAVLAIAFAALGAAWVSAERRIAGLCAASDHGAAHRAPDRRSAPRAVALGEQQRAAGLPAEIVHRLVDSIGIWLLGCLLAAALSLVLLRSARARLVTA